MKSHDLVEVRIVDRYSSSFAYGIFLLEDCLGGTVVRELSKEDIIPSPTRTSIQISENIHAEDDIGKYINHACDPTCEIQGHSVVALRNLSAGEEVTFDYSKNETYMANPFICKCCGKLIRGNRFKK